MNGDNYTKGRENGAQSAELKQVSEQMKRGFDRIYGLFEEHQEYHEQNETRWGFVAMMSRHPFKTFVLGGSTVIVLLVIIVPSLLDHPVVKVARALLD